PQTEMSRRVAGRRERAVRQVLAIVVVEARGAPAVAGVRFLRSLAAIEAAVGRAVERGGRIRRRALVTGIPAADDASPAHTRAAVRTVVAGRAAFRRDLERRGTGGVQIAGAGSRHHAASGARGDLERHVVAADETHVVEVDALAVEGGLEERRRGIGRDVT